MGVITPLERSLGSFSLLGTSSEEWLPLLGFWPLLALPSKSPCLPYASHLPGTGRAVSANPAILCRPDFSRPLHRRDAAPASDPAPSGRPGKGRARLNSNLLIFHKAIPAPDPSAPHLPLSFCGVCPRGSTPRSLPGAMTGSAPTAWSLESPSDPCAFLKHTLLES